MGAGKEGFVFREGDRVFKLFIEGRFGFYDGQLHFLRGVLLGPDPVSSRLVPLLDLVEAGDEVIFVSPFVQGTPYSGGHWDDLVQLVRDCWRRGVVLNNINPMNLLVTPAGLVHLDLGKDVDRLTQSRLSQMVNRAYLTFRYHGRPDLPLLMRRGLWEQGLEELEGVEVFKMDVGVFSPLREPETRPPPARPIRDVTLQIRTCAMEWRTIEFQVRHLVSQLEGPQRFRERVVVWDANKGPFPRQYEEANVDALREALSRLLGAGVIDRLVEVPQDSSSVRSTALRWFSLETTDPRSLNGEPTHSSLYGFDQCRTDLILQVDSDILIGRPVPEYDCLAPMIDVLDSDPNALTVSLPPLLPAPQPYTPGDGASKWRVEARCSLLDLRRLERLLPLPNRLVDGRLELSWYRALDQRLAVTHGQSYRGGSPSAFFVHVPNLRKTARNGWFNIACAVQRGRVFGPQAGHVDLVGTQEDWLGRREEDLVFLVRGRDVPQSKLQRCIGSLLVQENQDFGIIFVDAGSTNGMSEYLEALCRGEFLGRATLYRNWDPVTSVENQATCIRSLVTRPDAVVALLDADDALLGRHAVERICKAYRDGADLTVGSVVRTDKHVDYTVSLGEPRHNRGANVWQHLSTFQRALFDRLRDEDLKVDGAWIPYAEDWAVMVPLVEMASHPVWMRDKVYLYDPDLSRRSFSREDRERMIARICQKHSYLPEPSLAPSA